MGVVHKLTLEVKDFIIEKKRLEPAISCRAITALVSDKFQIKLSKSSANYLFKQAGLSFPVGRRPRPGRGTTGPVYSGMLLLKAADSLFGGSFYIAEAAKKITAEAGASDKAEALLESRMRKFLSEGETEGRPATAGILDNGDLIAEACRILKEATEEALYVKITFPDGKTFYLDGQLHTIWPSGRIPPDFSSPLYDLEKRLETHFSHGRPLALFFAPGYREPGREFFEFIKEFSSAEKQRLQLAYYDRKQGVIKETAIESSGTCKFIFGIWPWQFKEYIKVNTREEFKQGSFTALKKGYYIAAAEADLLGLENGKGLDFSSCVLKDGLNEKVKLAVLSSPANAEVPPEGFVKDYLDAWPSPEDSLQSFSQRIEAFIQKKSLPWEGAGGGFAGEGPSFTMEALCDKYLELLDLYIKRHFFPPKYLAESPDLIKKRFYLQKINIKQSGNSIIVDFHLPAGQTFLKDIDYICQRVNERQIVLGSGKRLWLKAFSPAA